MIPLASSHASRAITPAQETLRIVVPGSALLSGRAIVATPQLRVMATNGTVQIRGTLLSSPTEAAIQSAAEAPNIRIEVLHDSWAPGVGVAPAVNCTWVDKECVKPISNDAASAELLLGFVAEQSEPQGWNAIVRPMLTPRHLYRPDDQTLLLTLPEGAREQYSISSPGARG